MAFSTAEEFDDALRSVRVAFDAGVTKDKAWRRRQLMRTWWMIEDNKDRIIAALHADLHKHAQETIFADIGHLQGDILHTINNLDAWTKDEKVGRSHLLNVLGGTTVRKEPLGVTLIISAWNFPFVLSLQPMIAAIAAGCAIILKPSDIAVASQNLLVELVGNYLDRDAIRCITAGPQEMQHILDQRFDHIFCTGSQNVAKIVYAAAAKHLTPVTLELGGQGPAIVTATANIDLTAKHIAAAKFMCAGQICLNVNHILVDPAVREPLVEALKKYFDVFMGGGARPDHYTHIINDRNFDRLSRLLEQSSGAVVYGGSSDRATRFFAPTLVTDVKPGDSLLSEELFGPILPIVDASLDTAIAYTRRHEHPLAIYAFTTSAAEKKRILDETQSGGVTFNDCALHAAAPDTPFGGVGGSGMGYYHGKYGMLTFSHLRAHMELPSWVEPLLAPRYPPYSLAKAYKLAPPVKPNFDREGNYTSSRYSFLLKTVVVVAVLAASTVGLWLLLYQRDRVRTVVTEIR